MASTSYQLSFSERVRQTLRMQVLLFSSSIVKSANIDQPPAPILCLLPSQLKPQLKFNQRVGSLKQVCTEMLIQKSVRFIPSSNFEFKNHVGGLRPALRNLDSQASAIKKWL